MTKSASISTDLLDRAIQFALEAHQNTPRKGSLTPYILHPLEAAAITATMTDDLEVISAAVLHDTVEDNKAVSLAQIEELFGARVKNLVAAETEIKEEDESGSWFRRKEATIRHLREKATEEEKMVTLGDKLSNIRAMYKDHTAMGDELWSRFNQTDKFLQAWYYKSIGDALASLEGYPAYREYRDLVNRVFSL